MAGSFDPLKVLSFDLETTSPNPFEARIVTSALVHIDAQGARPKEMLADPGVEIPEEATAVHGISTEHAREHGRPHDEVVKETIDTIYQAWQEGYTLIVFNASYDLTVLRQLSPSFIVSGPVYDPFVIDKTLDRYRKGKRTLGALCEEYGVRLDNAHEATADALAAARLAWVQARKRFSEEISGMDSSELMEFQAVNYYQMQVEFRKYLEGQGKDPATVNTSWPVQG